MDAATRLLAVLQRHAYCQAMLGTVAKGHEGG